MVPTRIYLTDARRDFTLLRRQRLARPSAAVQRAASPQNVRKVRLTVSRHRWREQVKNIHLVLFHRSWLGLTAIPITNAKTLFHPAFRGAVAPQCLKALSSGLCFAHTVQQPGKTNDTVFTPFCLGDRTHAFHSHTHSPTHPPPPHYTYQQCSTHTAPTPTTATPRPTKCNPVVNTHAALQYTLRRNCWASVRYMLARMTRLFCRRLPPVLHMACVCDPMCISTSPFLRKQLCASPFQCPAPQMHVIVLFPMNARNGVPV